MSPSLGARAVQVKRPQPLPGFLGWLNLVNLNDDDDQGTTQVPGAVTEQGYEATVMNFGP